MRLIALTSLTYDTRPLAAGDAFEASERDGLMLIARGRAAEAPADAEPAPEDPEPEALIEGAAE